MAFVQFTLGDIRASVRRKLDDDGFDTATIDEAANDFQFELFNNNRIRFMEQSATVAFGSGATSQSLPSDFMNLINFTVLDSATEFRDITKDGYADYETFMANYANYTVAPASRIYAWTFYGEGIRIGAPTDAAYNTHVDYTRSPVLMAAATDNCELPINNRELMTLGTLERCMRINEDYNESDKEWSRLQTLRTAFIKNYGRGGAKVGPQTVRSNRRGSGTWTTDNFGSN